jgi:hypothetical protein
VCEVFEIENYGHITFSRYGSWLGHVVTLEVVGYLDTGRSIENPAILLNALGNFVGSDLRAVV